MTGSLGRGFAGGVSPLTRLVEEGLLHLLARSQDQGRPGSLMPGEVIEGFVEASLRRVGEEDCEADPMESMRACRRAAYISSWAEAVAGGKEKEGQIQRRRVFFIIDISFPGGGIGMALPHRYRYVGNRGRSIFRGPAPVRVGGRGQVEDQLSPLGDEGLGRATALPMPDRSPGGRCTNGNRAAPHRKPGW